MTLNTSIHKYVVESLIDPCDIRRYSNLECAMHTALYGDDAPHYAIWLEGKCIWNEGRAGHAETEA